VTLQRPLPAALRAVGQCAGGGQLDRTEVARGRRCSNRLGAR
jgi:hypothetical protein